MMSGKSFKKGLAAILGCLPVFLYSQTTLNYKVQMQSTNGGGEYAPLWLNANKYGLSSVEACNGYLQAGVYKPLADASERKWSWGAGLSLAAAYRFTSPVVVQEAYAELRWLKGVLTAGSKEYPMELKNNRLSSGSQTLGINARPVPQVRMALPDYWTFAGGWIGLKGHIAYGMTTDDGWQKDFTQCHSRRTKDTWLHTKAGYLRFGNEKKFPLTVEVGVEMSCQFGGSTTFFGSDFANGKENWTKNSTSLKTFLEVLYGGGTDVNETVYQNAGGNQMGSWVARVNYDAPRWNLGVYMDWYFDDHSSMFLTDYDGYGSGDQWNVKENNRYIGYPLKDIMLGAELKLKRFPWLHTVVLEYLYTKFQSGAIYHDHTENMPDHLGGRDDFYNHGIYTGWQHWGQSMGSPLYRSPIYNTSGRIYFENNRFVAYHAGVEGHPCKGVDYRMLATYQKGYGTYEIPYAYPKYNFSWLLEASYTFDDTSRWRGWAVTGALGLDRGKLLGDNCGFQLTLTKTGVLDLKRKGMQ